MKAILTILFAVVTLHVSGSPEDMYSLYDKEGKYRDMQEQMDKVIQNHKQAEQERNAKTNVIVVISVIMGLVPMGYIVYMILKERKWETNPQGTKQALGIALLGGLLLFAINFASLYVKVIYEDEFYRYGPVVFGLVIVVGTIVLLCKSMKSK